MSTKEEVADLVHKPSAIIVADGGIDLPEGYADRFGIRVVPLIVNIESKPLRSGIDITTGEFYSYLRQGGLPTTSQPSVGEFLAVYQDAAQAGLPILSFHLSEGLSGAVRSARTAREMLPEAEIHIVDTGTLSGAMALQVLVASEMASKGAPIDEIIETTKAIGKKADLYFTCDTLEYLRRGGRIGRVAGYVGSLLGVRPIITVDKSTGTYTANSRARSFKGAVGQIVENAVAAVGETREICCVILHGDCLEMAERLEEKLRERLNVRWAEIVRANPALGVHIGPETIGLAFFPGVLPIPTLAAAIAV